MHLCAGSADNALGTLSLTLAFQRLGLAVLLAVALLELLFQRYAASLAPGQPASYAGTQRLAPPSTSGSVAAPQFCAFSTWATTHLHNVRTRSYCPHTFLSLDFQCRDDVSELN